MRAYTLEQRQLSASLMHVGDAQLSLPLFERLERHQPVKIAILGASVAMSAGCDRNLQPHARCADFDGSVGAKRWAFNQRLGGRPVRGFLLQALDWLNATWPHPQHRVHNGAADATKAGSLERCMLGAIPSDVDLVLLEFTSQPENDFSAIERIVRRLRKYPKRPPLVHVATRDWCRCTDAATGARVIEDWRYNRSCGADCGVSCSLPPQMFRSWRGQEDSMAKLCRHYGISCVSLRDAIYSEVMAAAPGYSMPEVAGDCVHPSKSTRGPAIMGDLVVHALQRLWDDARPLLRASARPEAPPLPPPLHRVERRQSKDGGDGISWRCYQLRPRADIRALNERTQTLAFTPGAVLANGSFARAADVAERASKASCSRLARCATRQDDVCVRDLGGWRYCTHTIARHPARKEGVVAMWPGAAMQLTVDASAPGVEPARRRAPPRRCESGGGEDGDGAAAMPMAEARAAARCGRSVLVSLMYLTSYDGMGAARVTCVDGCECAPHLFDAFEASDRRNVSVVVERTFAVTPAAQCTLRFVVTNRTRSSGHKFKIVNVAVGAPLGEGA